MSIKIGKINQPQKYATILGRIAMQERAADSGAFLCFYRK
jgi:hypothetical protein